MTVIIRGSGAETNCIVKSENHWKSYIKRAYGHRKKPFLVTRHEAWANIWIGIRGKIHTHYCGILVSQREIFFSLIQQISVTCLPMVKQSNFEVSSVTASIFRIHLWKR